ncbi:MAG TPA: lysylphosphatidylglycerol synthase transmembrane domain-containing protein [Terriglobales bacterium]|nr:lysylphosphatidylglycerol synthase transmembrane domain-containing protein [Terriglobales bacterium]
MSKKRILAYVIVTAILAALVYVQFRTWKDFDWLTFWDQSKQISPRHILQAIALIYVSYFLRALRWKIFLQPVRKEVSTLELIPPTLVGFTGLALLGRPGELIRPYLIARRANLTFSSQMAAWAIERIFDVGGFTVLMVLAIFLPTELRFLPNPEIYPRLRVGGFLLVALVAGLALGAFLVAQFGEALAAWIEVRFSHLAANFGHRVAQRLREFHGGLDTIHSPLSFLQLSGVSILMWWLIALAYREVTHAYGPALEHMTVSKVLLLMGSSMLGSLIQLPGVGGGSQLATISALQHIFHASHELAASCGILLWLTTFVAVVPAGLLLAHRERLSLRKLSEESEQEEARAELSPSPPLV